MNKTIEKIIKIETINKISNKIRIKVLSEVKGDIQLKLEIFILNHFEDKVFNEVWSPIINQLRRKLTNK